MTYIPGLFSSLKLLTQPELLSSYSNLAFLRMYKCCGKAAAIKNDKLSYSTVLNIQQNYKEIHTVFTKSSKITITSNTPTRTSGVCIIKKIDEAN